MLSKSIASNKIQLQIDLSFNMLNAHLIPTLQYAAMVLILRTCGAYHPHHMCLASAQHVLSTRTKPMEYQYTTHMIRYRAFIPFLLIIKSRSMQVAKPLKTIRILFTEKTSKRPKTKAISTR